VIEDVHWADEATLDMLRFLGRRMAGTPVLIVATFRDDEVSSIHPLVRLLGDLPSSPYMVRVHVPPLTEPGVRALILESGGDQDPHALFEQTGGNPFYVTELLATPADSVPGTVRDAVLARASRLSADARIVLAAAAVLGQPADLPLLLAVSSRPAASVDECVTAGLLVDAGPGWDFRHALARFAIQESLLPAQRADLHVAALRCLRAAGVTDDRRLAYHAEMCGDGVGVLAHAPAAAARAARLGAHREAAQLYRTLLRFCPVGDARRPGLYAALSYECYVTGQMEEALLARREELDLAVTPTERGDAERWLSRLSWYLARNDDAHTWADRAIDTLEPLGESRALAMAYSNKAQLCMLADDVPRAMHWGTRALALARRIGDRDTEIHALNNLGITKLLTGEESDGWALVQQSLDKALAAETHEHAARAFANLGSTAVRLRRFADADRTIRAGLAYCTERDLDSWKHYLGAWQGVSLAEQGEYDAAQEHLAALLTNPELPPVARIPANVAAAQLLARRDGDATALLEEAQRLASQTNEAQRLVPVAVARAEAAWLVDRTAEIPGLLAEAFAVITHPSPWDLGEIVWWSALAGAVPDLPGDLAKPFGLMVQAVAAPTDRVWRAAADSWRAIGCPLWVAQCLGREADLSAAREALQILDDLSAPAIRRALLRDRHRQGLPVPSAPSPGT
jgi:tetratricopeptide (TPR) repeat protein